MNNKEITSNKNNNFSQKFGSTISTIKNKTVEGYDNIDKDKLKSNASTAASKSLDAATKAAKFTGDVADILVSNNDEDKKQEVRNSKSTGAKVVADVTITTGKVAKFTTKAAFSGIKKATKAIKKK